LRPNDNRKKKYGEYGTKRASAPILVDLFMVEPWLKLDLLGKLDIKPLYASKISSWYVAQSAFVGNFCRRLRHEKRIKQELDAICSQGYVSVGRVMQKQTI
jgi:hypothetical protein